MSNDDGLEELGFGLNPERRSWWRGLATGGPLDGGEIRVEAMPFLPMRGLQVNIFIGDTVEESDWHVYRYATGVGIDFKRGYLGGWVHRGVIDGDPKMPEG